MIRTFKSDLIQIMVDQATIYTEENINGYLYGEILSSLYATGSLQIGIDISLEDRNKLDNHCEFISMKRSFKVSLLGRLDNHS